MCAFSIQVQFLIYSCSLANGEQKASASFSLTWWSPPVIESRNIWFPHLLQCLLWIYGSSCCYHESIPGNAQTHSPRVKCIFYYINHFHKWCFWGNIKSYNVHKYFNKLSTLLYLYAATVTYHVLNDSSSNHFFLYRKCTYEKTGYLFCSLKCAKGIKG